MRTHKAHARHRRKIAIASVAVIVPVAVAAYLVVLLNFRSSESTFRSHHVHNGINMRGKVLTLDPIQREMTIRLRFTPLGDYEDFTTSELTESMNFYVLSEKGDVQVPFAAGIPMKPLDITVGLSGQVTDYPFDDYEGGTYLYFLPQSGVQDIGLGNPVRTNFSLDYGVNGYDIGIEDDSDDHDVHFVYVQAHRAFSTLFFAVFVMVLMGALAFASIAIAVVLTHWGREIGAGVLGYLAALLFAFPAIRSVMPGAPPIGSYSDYLSFFWSEVMVAFTLLILAIIWLTREVRGGSASEDDDATTALGPPSGPPNAGR